jgi:Lrp/AsnC family transcriptional regulator for asnA, asnC and gidA
MDMGRRRTGMIIDAMDARIIELVQRDARMPNTAIAELVGLSEAAVRKRLDRLVREQIITLSAHADPLKIGFEIWALISVQTLANRTNAIAEHIARHPTVTLVGLVTGAFDIFVVALFRSTTELNTFVNDELRALDGVTRTTTSHVTKMIKRDFAFGVPISEDFRKQDAADATH